MRGAVLVIVGSTMLWIFILSGEDQIKFEMSKLAMVRGVRGCVMETGNKIDGQGQGPGGQWVGQGPDALVQGQDGQGVGPDSQVYRFMGR